MQLKIRIEPAEFNEGPHGNKKLCVTVEFPNCISKTTDKPFKWMPTYPQLKEIEEALKYVEKKSWKNENNKN